MKKTIVLAIFFALMLGSTALAVEADILDFYEANTVYHYDLDGDGNLDTIKFQCNKIDTSILHINDNVFYYHHIRPEIFIPGFKIVDIDTSDTYKEIVIGYTVLTHKHKNDNRITFYRYTGEEGNAIDGITGDIHSIGDKVTINGDGVIVTTVNASYVKNASYLISYNVYQNRHMNQISRNDIYYYQNSMKASTQRDLQFHNAIDSKEYVVFQSGQELTILGQLYSWIWVQVGENTYWLKGNELEGAFLYHENTDTHSSNDKSEFLNFIGKSPDDVIREFGNPDSKEDNGGNLVLFYEDYGVIFIKQANAANPDVINGISITEGALLDIVIGETFAIPEDFSVKVDGQIAELKGYISGYEVVCYVIDSIMYNVTVFNHEFTESGPTRTSLTDDQITTIATDLIRCFGLFSEQNLILDSNAAEVFAEYLITYNNTQHIIDNYIPFMDNLIPYELTVINDGKIDARYVEALGEAVFGIDINSSRKEYQIHLADPGMVGIVLKNLNKVNGQYRTTFDLYDEIGQLFLTLEMDLRLTNEGYTRVEYVSTKRVNIGSNSGDVSGLLNSYDEIYSQSDLMGCIDYFDSKYNLFTREERTNFAEKISLEIIKRGYEYGIIPYAIRPASIPAPLTIDYVNSLYRDIYDGTTNTLSLGLLEDQVKEAITKVNRDEVFMVVKSYFVMADVFEDSGFAVAIHPDVYKKIERALDITFVRVSDYLPITYSTELGERVEGIDLIARPREVVTVSDTSWSSNETYPEVLVESVDKLKLLEGAWKTNVYVPVKIEDESQNTTNNGLSKYTAENINGTQVNYAEYSAVIVPMYNGINNNKLTPYTTNVGANQFTDVTFAVFGSIGSLKIFHTNHGMNEEYTITRVGDIENSLVTIKTQFPTDFANIIVRGFVKNANGEYESIEFSMDDMRDLTEYKPIMIK